MGKKRVILWTDPDVHKVVKIRAAMSGKKMEEYLRDHFVSKNKHIKEWETINPKRRKKDNGFWI